MVQLLYIISIGVGAAAFSVVAHCVHQWRWDNPELWRLRDRPGVVETFRARAEGRKTGDGGPTASPLVVQAEASKWLFCDLPAPTP